MIALLTMALAAQAAEAQVGVGHGFEWVVNDPFSNRHGVRLGVHVAPRPVVELGLIAAWFPDLGSGPDSPDWSSLAKRLFVSNSVSPDISEVLFEGQLTVGVFPVRLPIGRWENRIGGYAGVAAVYTVDDLVALQAVDEPAAQATEEQIHPASVWGLAADTRMRWFGVRVRIEHVSYLEVVYSTTVHSKDPLLVGVEVIAWFP